MIVAHVARVRFSVARISGIKPSHASRVRHDNVKSR